MHELSVTQSIVDSVLGEMNARGLERVGAVHLKLGRMTTFVPDCVKFYYDALTADTALAGSELIIEEVNVTGCCNNCGAELEFEEPFFICPECGSVDIEVLTGREILINALEVPDEGDIRVGNKGR
ncbi:MAG: hydrogenase maturation nickel metallochaperone HypA [Candidatus Coatesbacteria bacterium]|nr:MAG: hydrogenase maturation nickel metallochaperone HypA [Candidatus Coatesbacteria bacterium]